VTIDVTIEKAYFFKVNVELQMYFIRSFSIGFRT
jgi:hypothetical protein